MVFIMAQIDYLTACIHLLLCFLSSGAMLVLEEITDEALCDQYLHRMLLDRKECLCLCAC